jgi:hypothetical protein
MRINAPFFLREESQPHGRDFKEGLGAESPEPGLSEKEDLSFPSPFSVTSRA